MKFSLAIILALLSVSCISSTVKGQGVSSIITPSLYNQMFPNRNPFYTHQAFIRAASAFPAFGTTGTSQTQRRELAAFFGQTSHETTGYIYIDELDKTDNAPYYGRGPMQLTTRGNYEQASIALGLGRALVENPGMVSKDPILAFKTAIWFWMTNQAPKPSCHRVMTWQWAPSNDDKSKNRYPGFGLTTNIINGGIECGKQQSTPQAKDRFTRYKQYCQMLGVDVGNNFGCRDQTPYQ